MFWLFWQLVGVVVAIGAVVVGLSLLFCIGCLLLWPFCWAIDKISDSRTREQQCLEEES